MRRALVLSLTLCAGCAPASSLLNEQCANTPPSSAQQTRPTASTLGAANAPYQNPQAPIERRVEDLLNRMSASEKAEMLSGSGWMESQANLRLGIPAIKMADGPMGVRNWTGASALTNDKKTANPVTTTAFPAGIAMAATWDTELVRAEGRVIAQQVLALGRDMILAPTVNVARTPLWGRNFEGYGEDPYLAARVAVAYIEGVQSEGVIATAKHFAANNQEYERHRIDERIDLRALHEIYFPAFKAAVQEAKVLAVMSAYNKVNGQYCAESSFLLTDVLRKAWGFQGFVISDWGSTYSTDATIRAGMDLEMPGGEPMRAWSSSGEFRAAGRGAGWLSAEKVSAAVAAHELDQATIDDSVRRILRAMFAAGLFERKRTGGGDLDTFEQRTLARTAATEGMVLLKNDRNLLPLDRQKVRSIAVIGPNASIARTGGGGSSQVRPRYSVSPIQGILNAAGVSVQVNYALGTPMLGDADYDADVKRRGELMQSAAALASKSDIAVVVVGNAPKLESEGFDRPTMDLPEGQDELIETVARANKKTIVVVAAGAPVTMTRWIHRVPTVLYAWYAGQEVGNALGDLLFGISEPSGKTPVTFPKRLEDSTAYGNYPGSNLRVDYAEGIYVGYRGFDRRHIEPLFPFGHGLTYTRFEYGELKLDTTTPKLGARVAVTIPLKNTGQRAGTEVVQLYLRDIESSIDRPEKELKGFGRVRLDRGESKSITLTLDQDAMSFFDPQSQQWKAEPGLYEVLVGASCSDIRSRATFELQATPR